MKREENRNLQEKTEVFQSHLVRYLDLQAEKTKRSTLSPQDAPDLQETKETSILRTIVPKRMKLKQVL